MVFYSFVFVYSKVYDSFMGYFEIILYIGICRSWMLVIRWIGLLN